MASWPGRPKVATRSTSICDIRVVGIIARTANRDEAGYGIVFLVHNCSTPSLRTWASDFGFRCAAGGDGTAPNVGSGPTTGITEPRPNDRNRLKLKLPTFLAFHDTDLLRSLCPSGTVHETWVTSEAAVETGGS